jgi:hypothetical protein
MVGRIHIIACLLGNATNNLWVLDLTLDLLDFNSYNYSYSLDKFATHKPETCLLVRHHFTSYLNCLPMSSLSVSVLTLFLTVSNQSQSQSYIATDGRSISKPWCRAPFGADDQIFTIV